VHDRCHVAPAPGKRGRPTLRTKGLKAGWYSLTIAVTRGKSTASVTAGPLLLDPKGRIANRHPAKKKK
jgi:hypothetical protein